MVQSQLSLIPYLLFIYSVPEVNFLINVERYNLESVIFNLHLSLFPVPNAGERNKDLPACIVDSVLNYLSYNPSAKTLFFLL